MGILFKGDYRPSPTNPQVFQYWTSQNIWMYAVLQRRVKTDKGKSIVEEHRTDFDAHQVIAKLIKHYTTSTLAAVRSAALLKAITTTTLDSTWSRPTLEFLNAFKRLVTEYNQLNPNAMLGGSYIMPILQNAVRGISELRRVHNDEQYNQVRGLPPLSYDQYMSLLESAAITYDSRNRTSRDGNRRD